MPLAGGKGGSEFGSSVNPIPTRGADYDHHITACPPRFENLTALADIFHLLHENQCRGWNFFSFIT